MKKKIPVIPVNRFTDTAYKPGFARCKICHCDISYGSGGKRDMLSHSKKKHIENFKIQKTNTVLPAIFVSKSASDADACTSTCSSAGSASESCTGPCCIKLLLKSNLSPNQT